MHSQACHLQVPTGLRQASTRLERAGVPSLVRIRYGRLHLAPRRPQAPRTQSVPIASSKLLWRGAPTSHYMAIVPNLRKNPWSFKRLETQPGSRCPPKAPVDNDTQLATHGHHAHNWGRGEMVRGPQEITRLYLGE